VADTVTGIVLTPLVVELAETLHVADSTPSGIVVAFGTLVPTPAPSETVHVLDILVRVVVALDITNPDIVAFDLYIQRTEPWDLSIQRTEPWNLWIQRRLDITAER
jgi:hypothetical protein